MGVWQQLSIEKSNTEDHRVLKSAAVSRAFTGFVYLARNKAPFPVPIRVGGFGDSDCSSLEDIDCRSISADAAHLAPRKTVVLVGSDQRGDSKLICRIDKTVPSLKSVPMKVMQFARMFFQQQRMCQVTGGASSQ